MTKENFSARGAGARGLSLGLLLLLGLAAAVRLDVLVVHGKGLIDLGLEGDVVLDAEQC